MLGYKGLFPLKNRQKSAREGGRYSIERQDVPLYEAVRM
jgi:hypothetical protein